VSVIQNIPLCIKRFYVRLMPDIPQMDGTQDQAPQKPATKTLPLRSETSYKKLKLGSKILLPRIVINVLK